MARPWNTVVETREYLADASRVLTLAQRDDVKTVLAIDPSCGAVIAGTGGLRKLRVAASGRGKRGGARAIYYFYNSTRPVFLLAIFAKNEKDDLSSTERKVLSQFVMALHQQPKGTKR